MKYKDYDVLIVGGGGAGLRASIAAAQQAQQTGCDLSIGLVSKVYPMRSHTVAAEGGAAAVTRDDDSFAAHIEDTVAGGDWLAEQSVVDYFVRHAHQELVQMEQWGCPWSRKNDGSVQVRRFGGMKIERTWFAADKTGFHMLHTLFQTSLRYDAIQRLDEFFVLDLLVNNGQISGIVALEIATGELHLIRAKSVILATGGAGRLFRFNTNGGIVTGDGMALAFRQGVALRDMEFVQYHPTGLPGSGILITEASRGEGGLMLNNQGYRYLQDYGLGPETPVGEPKNKYMELGPRDKLSQAFWQEQQAGRTGRFGDSDVVYLDLRHLGKAYLHERLPFICELAKSYVNVDPVKEPIPVRPAVHYTMGGITTNAQCETSIKGLFAAGECASVGLHGANRLGSNSLSELLVFGRLAGEQAVIFSQQQELTPKADLEEHFQAQQQRINTLRNQQGRENWVAIKRQLIKSMEEGCGIYREQAGMQSTLNTIRELKIRYQQISLKDKSLGYNTELLQCIEVGFGLDVAEATCLAALQRRESRGAHQRLDEGCTTRDDEQFLQHSLVYHQANGDAHLSWQPVDISLLPPATRAYGDAGKGVSS
ncbi:fumarate reductase (quinol) flavoprotein subunit [Aliiglaciecola sp. 3_MG-2023]|uniref:fumarate reductase (quinol) flavoprotein subunit n=1 Tax=Aliiglaciecola sp. 3_MG-2023 TaxID=3062644 RepID=UPI0026E1DB51|nr:fumarate reductase (quinol) flavoprotein subunit [Aliiglaciecola sp. 3_MG-2023]MDO6695647.1 fumarate reductase (quinol) flavoprotein subunit [Aliiglaciecola sp. 3_MG-2023]